MRNPLRIRQALFSAAALLGTANTVACSDEAQEPAGSDVADVSDTGDVSTDSGDDADAVGDTDTTEVGDDVSADVAGDADVALDVGSDSDAVETDVGDTDAAVVLDPAEYPLGTAGPFNVGYRQMEVTYDDPGSDATRTIPVSIWYPTEDTEGRGTTYIGFVADNDVFVDATLASPVHDGRYPVHLHSHGFQGFSGTSAFMMRHFASQGWVAIAPDHVGNLLSDHTDPLPFAHNYLKVHDLTESLDLLEELPDDDPLHGLADTDGVLMSGHSYGTYAAWAIAGATFDMEQVRSRCSTSAGCDSDQSDVFVDGLGDARVSAVLPLAGTYRDSWFGDTGYTSVDIPVFSITGSADNPGNSTRQWERLEGELDITWVDIEGACHQSFALGGCTTLPNLEGFEILNTYAMALGRASVLGDESERVGDVLDGTAEVDERATLSR